jgi:hypothetical protein
MGRGYAPPTDEKEQSYARLKSYRAGIVLPYRAYIRCAAQSPDLQTHFLWTISMASSRVLGARKSFKTRSRSSGVASLNSSRMVA